MLWPLTPPSVSRSLGHLQKPPVPRRRAPLRGAAHRPRLHDAGDSGSRLRLLGTRPDRPAGRWGHGVRGPARPGSLQRAPALSGAVQVRLVGWDPRGIPRFQGPAGIPGLVLSPCWWCPSYRVKFLVMDCHGPKVETRWSDPILLRRGTGGSGAGTASPSPCIPWGAASPLCHHPKPQRGEEVPKLSCSPYSWVPPILPLCPSPRAHPARSPSTVDPTPVRRSSDVVVIASILASLGAGLAVAALGAMGYEG